MEGRECEGEAGGRAAGRFAGPGHLLGQQRLTPTAGPALAGGVPPSEGSARRQSLPVNP
ncbi:hypothetical protein ACFXBB_22985 [Streptomyces scopuliridis]|uniref:hypothetical protein n=1 Tax=Streptomyces scopuliridis TaxID=452529 RepID=UPI003674A1D7